MLDDAHGVHDYVYDERNADILVSINGALKHRDEATVSVFESGYLLGDGVWEGKLEWRPETTGRPLLKVVAKDGEGERANIDFLSRNLVVEAPADDMRGLLLAGGALGLVSLVGLVAFVVARRRRALEEIDLLTSWDAFKAPSQEPVIDQKAVPALEDDIMDGTDEVQAELDSELDLDME